MLDISEEFAGLIRTVKEVKGVRCKIVEEVLKIVHVGDEVLNIGLLAVHSHNHQGLSVPGVLHPQASMQDGLVLHLVRLVSESVSITDADVDFGEEVFLPRLIGLSL